MCVCVCNMYILTFSVHFLCTNLYCFVVILLFCVFTFCSCFVVLCIFIFVRTNVGLLPPGESPIAVSNNNINNNNNNKKKKKKKKTQYSSHMQQKKSCNNSHSDMFRLVTEPYSGFQVDIKEKCCDC
jgi:hypothetical protein